MSTPPKKPVKRVDSPLTDKGELYLPTDFRAGADAVHQDTESAWARFQEAEASADMRFADTAPASTLLRGEADERAYALTVPGSLLASTLASGPPSTARPVTVEEAMIEARRNNRVCPKPEVWQDLFDLLPNKQRSKPAPPLIGSAWAVTPSLSKRMCLREHLEWAETHGQLDSILSFMRSLAETDWHHMDD